MRFLYFFSLLLTASVIMKAEEIDIGLGYSITTNGKIKSEDRNDSHDFVDSQFSLNSFSFSLYVGGHPMLLNDGGRVLTDLESRFEFPMFIYRFNWVDINNPYDLWIVGVIDGDFGPVYLHARTGGVTLKQEKEIIKLLRTVKKKDV